MQPFENRRSQTAYIDPAFDQPLREKRSELLPRTYARGGTRHDTCASTASRNPGTDVVERSGDAIRRRPSFLRLASRCGAP
jgi:hypothetical protein